MEQLTTCEYYSYSETYGHDVIELIFPIYGFLPSQAMEQKSAHNELHLFILIIEARLGGTDSL